ncbi:MAG: porin [Candidatus Margulisiibacteriota bacterium]
MKFIIILLVFLQLASSAYALKLKIDDRVINISSYLQTRYTIDPSRKDSFSIPRLRSDIWGDIDENVGYLIELDATASPALIYGWIDLKPEKATKFRVGKFYYPFGLEYTTPPSRFDTINPTYTLWNLFGYSRDIGIQFSQDKENCKYAIALMNGADNQTSDDNESKDLLGRYVFKGIKDLDVGLSFQVGKAGTMETERQRIGAELNYKLGSFGLKSEYVRAIDNSVRKVGWYLQPSVWLSSSVQGLIRYEFWDPNTQAAGDRQTITTFGINAFIDPAAKLQVNYELKNEEVDTSNNALLMQLQLSF